MICYWYDAPSYLFFASDLPGLLYYSHIPTAVISLIIGTIVLLHGKKILLNRLLFALSVCFSLWIFINLITWTNISSDILLFSWSFFGILQALMSILSIYLVYVFLYKKDIPTYYKIIFLLLLTPVFIFAPSTLSLEGFNLILCDAFTYEGLIYKGYYTGLGVLAMIWIFILLTKHYKYAEKDFRKQIIFIGAGVEFFLFTFFTILFLATYLTGLGFLDDSRLEFYGLFGMTFLMIMISTLIIQFKTFNVSILAPQALMIAILILVASQFTYVKSITAVILTSVTLILTTIASLMIVRYVKKEIKQREAIEQLAGKLKKANVRLKELDKMKSEFVSIASHQLRSPLTSIRGYASMLLEGSYGKLTPKIASAVERISDSGRYMASSIEDYLNVSRIESGNMKYELSDFNLKEEAEHVADDKRQEAIKKGLLITFKSDVTKHGIVNADIGKTQQILHNLVNNAIKYTPRGTITIFAHDDAKKKIMYVDIIDSGIGMKADELDNIFGKFERAHNANQTNVTGTGLGLFVARMMARQMQGDVTAHSDGVGHGSTFRLQIPLQM